MPLIQNFQDNLSLQFEARASDLIRVAKLVNPLSPSGAKFSANQALLLANSGDLTLRQIGTSVASTIAAILAQVPVSGTGIHFYSNELLRAERATYLANKNAAAEAKQDGRVLIVKTRNMRGLKSVDYDYGLGRTGFGDSINVDHDYTTDTAQAQSFIDADPDLVPFYIKVLKRPEKGATPFNLIMLRSFITTIGDSYNGTWSTSNFIGRGEPFYVYTGHTRKLNLSLKVAVFSKGELVPLYNKLNALASTTAPEYSAAGYMKGVLVKMTIGNYIKDLIGHIDSVNYNISTDFPWETEDRSLIIPTVLDVTLSFTATPGQSPQAAINGITSTFINQQS